MRHRARLAALAGLVSIAMLAFLGCGPEDMDPDGSVDGGTDGGAVGCVSAAECDDGDPCNGEEACDPTGKCQPGTPLADGTSCGEGLSCSGGVCVSDTCGNGVVEAGERCDDGNDVEDDVCDNACRLNDPPDGQPITAPERQWTYVPIDGAVCRDGSDTGIMVNLSETSDDVVIYLQGGGACFHAGSCALLNPPSFNPTLFNVSTGIFNRTNPANPVADWSFVYVPYCTGDVHAGDTENMVAGALQQFRGYRNVALALERVVPTFADASRVLLTGESAGGFGAAANAEQVQRDFGDVPVVLLDDSGPPMGSAYLAPCLQRKWNETWGFENTILRDCGADCPDSSDYVLDLAAHLARRYPNNVGALFSNSQDGIIRLFYGFADPATDTCLDNAVSLSGPTFEMGLEDFRTFISGETDHFGTYYLEGTGHTCIGTACFYGTTVEGVSLPDYLADLLAGSTSHIGP